MTRWFLPVFALFLLTTLESTAQPVAGASYIGLCSPHFPCKAAIRVFRHVEKPALGYLADSFSSDGSCACLDSFMALKATKYVRVHVTNGTCFPERGRKCGRDDFFNGLSLKQAEGMILARNKNIIRGFKHRLARLHAYFGNRALVRYSPTLESPFNDRARAILMKVAARIVPKESLVDSTTSQHCLPGYICEKHGDAPRFLPGEPCIGDLDGVSFHDSRLDPYAIKTAACEAAFYWTNSFNLLPRWYEGSFIPPSARRYQPTSDDFTNLKYCLMVKWH